MATIGLIALGACLPVGKIKLKEKNVDGKMQCRASADTIKLDREEAGYVWLVDNQCGADKPQKVEVGCFKRDGKYHDAFKCTPVPFPLPHSSPSPLSVYQGRLLAITCELNPGCGPSSGGKEVAYAYTVFVDGKKAYDPEIRVKGGGGIADDACRALDIKLEPDRQIISRCDE